MRRFRSQALFSVKLASASFIVFMLLCSFSFVSSTSVNEVTVMPTITVSNKSIYDIFQQDSCSSSWTMYLFAFVLGSFWNIKRLRMIGIV